MYSLRYYIDSWVEVSSQPSSSSLSSAANDEIITTGLRVERRESSSAYHHNRRRRLTAEHISHSLRELGSSQDEYEESESESDRVLSGSNEDVFARSRGDALLLRTGSASSAAAPSSDEDDDNSTALAMQINTAPFVPQPNAFTHPPASLSRTSAPDPPRPNCSAFSSSSRRTAIRSHSYSSTRSSRRQPQHSPYNMISPSYQADHDAALRASLITLLSCAAAARGLPKNDTQPAAAGPSAQPSSFRLVPESVAMGEESSEEEHRPAPPARTGPSPASNRSTKQHKPPTSSSNASASASKPRRRASSSKERASSHSSTSKKARRSNIADSVISVVSPTVMTWVISAGVVVLLSAISFSAGYALGREVGRTEAGSGIGSMAGDDRASAACGKEAVKGGLKRLRWGAAAAGAGVSV